MNKFLKWLLLTVGFVVVLVVIAAVLLPMLIDPNNYKEEISKAVFEKTGRELTIGGDIEWTVFPSIGLGLSDVTLGNREGLGNEPMLDVGEAEISVKLVPLLSKRVEIGMVELSDVSLRLERKAGGENNRQGPGKAGAEPATSEDTGMDSFSVYGIDISNAHFSLGNADRTTGLDKLETSNIELGQPFDLEGGFSVSLPEQTLAGDVVFSGLIQAAANGKQLGIEGMDVTFEGARGEGADKLALDARVSADADIDLDQGTARLRNFAFNMYDLSVRGDLDLTSLNDSPQFSGTIEVAEFSPKSFAAAMGMETPVTRSDSALTRLQADMRFSGSTDSVNMQKLKARFDNSNLEGDFSINNFDSPKLAFDLQIDRLDLDDYEAMESTATSGGQAREADLSANVFRGFSGSGEFRIGTLVLSGLTATKVSATMTARDSIIRFNPVVADFYGGKHEGDISIDATGPKPVLSAQLGLSGVQAGGLVEDLTGSARLLGQTDLFLQVRSDITNSQTSIQTLSGEIVMSVLNGAITGIDVTKALSLVQGVLGKQKDVSGAGTAAERTEFAELSISGVIKNGVMKSDDLIMQSPLIRATGSGSFNLAGESIDYLLEPVLIGDTGVKGLDDLSGVAVPIRLSGNLYEPDYKVDVAAALLSSQKGLIDEKKNELIGKLLGDEESSEQDSEKGDAKDESGEESDPVSSLLGNLLGGKKKKDEKKDDGG